MTATLTAVPDLREQDCPSCKGTGNRRTALQNIVDCDSCAGRGLVPAEHDPRKIIVTLADDLPAGTQICVGRYDDGSPDVILRADCDGRWIPATLAAGITVEERSQ